MDRLPQRASLVSQTVDILRESIASGKWPQWLPGELELTQRLHVSRVTLRAALEELERENLVRGGQGRRREILRNRKRPASRQTNKIVVLLSPAPLHQLPSATVFWMDELRKYLSAAGWPLEVRESAVAYRRKPAHALEELSARAHPAGWVLYRSTPEMQRWFSGNERSAVIAGSRHPGISLSSVDVDYAAACRHAAGRFLANGHRRLAIVRPDTKLAGDLESVAEFQSGAGTEVPLALHDESVTGICRALDRLFAKKPAPTGLFVFHAAHLLTVLGWLHRRQLRVPNDVSVVCRDSEPFLESVIPIPARYTLNASHYARRISRAVADLVADGHARPNQMRIMPTFVRGETLGLSQ
jgi:LacI family transcriptional regulator